MKRTFILLCLFFSLVYTGNALAEEKTLWSMIGGACVPNHDTAKNELVVRNAGGVTFAPGKTGEAVLFCPVVNAHQAIKRASWIKLVFNRTLASGEAYAYLYRLDMKTGRLYRVGRGASVPLYATGLGTFKGSVGESETSGHKFEEGYFYYVRITLKQHSALNRMSVKGVSLGID